MAMRTRLSSTSASAEIFWTWRNPSMYGRICAEQGKVSQGETKVVGSPRLTREG